MPLLAGIDHESFIRAPHATDASRYGGAYGGGYGAGLGAELGGGYGGFGARAPDGVWRDFERKGYATFLLEEMHDGCADLESDAPSSAAKLFYSRLGADRMPHHNAWQLFCSEDVKPCCSHPDSFLRPGRRQCVGGRELPKLMLDYVAKLCRTYAGARGGAGVPRFGLLNLMAAHEHFMHRLGGLDELAREFLLSIEGALRTDSALFLLTDHGTHGIWYNDFGVGMAEHRAPMLTLLLPSRFVDAHPGVDAALRRNTRRRVTAYDLHATLRHLAAWPAMPPPSAEATSLFVDLEDGRSCEAARVPAKWCVEPERSC